MSPRNKKKRTPVIKMPPLDDDAGSGGSNSRDHYIDPRHTAALEEHIKSTTGGSLVSVCL